MGPSAPPPRLCRLRLPNKSPSPVQRTGPEIRRQRFFGQWAGKWPPVPSLFGLSERIYAGKWRYSAISYASNLGAQILDMRVVERKQTRTMYLITKPNPPECLRNFVSNCANCRTETIAPFFAVFGQTVGRTTFRITSFNAGQPLPHYPKSARICSQATFQNGQSRVHPRTDAIAELVGEDGVGALDRPTGRVYRLRPPNTSPSPVQRTGPEIRRQRLFGQWAGKGPPALSLFGL